MEHLHSQKVSYTDEEIEKLREMGLECFYIHPWDLSKNSKTAMDYINKTTDIYTKSMKIRMVIL